MWVSAIFPTAVRDPAVVALAGKVRYQIDPKIPIRRISPATSVPRCATAPWSGTPPYMRGGAQEPLTRADIQDKFLLNVANGGWDADRAARSLEVIGTLFDGPVDSDRVARIGDARNAQRRWSKGICPFCDRAVRPAQASVLIAGALALVAGIGPAWDVSSFSVGTIRSPTRATYELARRACHLLPVAGGQRISRFRIERGHGRDGRRGGAPIPKPADVQFGDRSRL